MKVLLSTVLSMMLLLTPMHSVFAADKNIITVGGLPFPPFIIAENNKVSGVIPDIIEEAVKRTGKKVEFKISNWPRAFKQVQLGKIDGIIPAMKTPDREKFLYYPSKELVKFEQVFFKAKGKSIKFDKSMESLKSYKIGRVRNARVSPAFDKAREGGLLKVEERNDIAQLLKGADRGRLDIVAIDRIVGLWNAKKLGLLQKVEPVNPSLGAIPVYLAFAKKNISAEYNQQVSKVLKEMHSDGTVNAIKKKYTGN